MNSTQPLPVGTDQLKAWFTEAYVAAQPLPPVDPNQRYSIPESIRYLRQSRAKVYTDIKAGRLKTIKSGSRIYITGSSIIAASTGSAVGV